MHCSNCGSKNENDFKFCQKCGIKLSIIQQEKKEEKPGVGIKYFAISTKRLVLFSILTFGIYEIYWFYKNWEALKKAENQNISPFWRAIFSVFFCYGLFKKVLESSKSYGYKELYSPGWLAAAYIVLLFIRNGLSRVESSSASIFWLIITLLTIVPLLLVQKAINFNNEKLTGDNNLKQDFSGGEVVLIVVGAFWFLLVLIGTFSS